MRHPQKGRQDLDLSLTTAVPEKECGVKDKSAPHPKNRFRHYRSAEFRVDGLDVPYQFRIWDITPESAGFFVKEGSIILPYLNKENTMDMKYYSVDSKENIRTIIEYITKNNNGRLKGQYWVGLRFMEAGEI